ncbi:hypothetical protein L1887_06232 [Cichorium endivia]|nr:hypothetical protein L1887_06232 [Cichorium endivia]
MKKITKYCVKYLKTGYESSLVSCLKTYIGSGHARFCSHSICFGDLDCFVISILRSLVVADGGVGGSVGAGKSVTLRLISVL